jgi:hypothetical protein
VRGAFGCASQDTVQSEQRSLEKRGLICFRESLLATTENIERVEALLRLLADHLAGDPRCAEASRLMRLPGSHNSKEAAWAEVQVLVNKPTRRYELEDLAEWLETVSPVLHRKPTDSGKGHDIEPDNPWLPWPRASATGR